MILQYDAIHMYDDMARVLLKTAEQSDGEDTLKGAPELIEKAAVSVVSV